MNYNMQGMDKSIPELFAMLKAAEVEIKKEHQVLMVSVGVKTDGSRVGGPNYASKVDGNRSQGTRCFTQVRALLMEVKPYVLLDLFLIIWVLQELIYHEIVEAKP